MLEEVELFDGYGYRLKGKWLRLTYAFGRFYYFNQGRQDRQPPRTADTSADASLPRKSTHEE